MNTTNQSMPDKPTVLVIDDTPENLSLMQALLRDRYKVKGANNGLTGLKRLRI